MLGRLMIQSSCQTHTIAPEGATGAGMMEAARKCIDAKRRADRNMYKFIICATIMTVVSGWQAVPDKSGHSILEKQIHTNEPKEIHEHSENYERN